MADESRLDVLLDDIQDRLSETDPRRRLPGVLAKVLLEGAVAVVCGLVAVGVFLATALTPWVAIGDALAAAVVIGIPLIWWLDRRLTCTVIVPAEETD